VCERKLDASRAQALRSPADRSFAFHNVACQPSRTTILWTLPLNSCPTADQCEPVREFPPLICM